MKRRGMDSFAVIVVGLVSVAVLSGCGKKEEQAMTEKTTAPVPPPASEAELHNALRIRNPNYNGQAKVAPDASGKIVAVDLSGTGVIDITPLKGMALMGLDLHGLLVSDLSALKGMQLQQLFLEDMPLEDLAPLKGMPLAELYLSRTRVKDLSPLAGAPLKQLNMLGCPVTDLTPLKGMPLEMLWLNETPVADISPLAECPIVSLTLHFTKVSDLSPLSGSKTLQRLHIGDAQVSDLTPLKDLNLNRLIFTPTRITAGMAVARDMKSLREIGSTFEGRVQPAQFWAQQDGE
jgi:internalin A